MRELKVLHVYRTYFPDPPGGLQEAIRQISIAAARFSVRSSVFALSPRPQPPVLDRAEGRVHRSRSWAAPASCDLGGPSAFIEFASLARSSDLVHYHFPWPFADLLHLLAPPKIPAVMTYHSDVVRQRALGALYGPLMRRTLKSMSAIVATSDAYAATSPVLSQEGIRQLVSVIPLGIDDRTYPAGDEAVFSRLALDPGQPFLLFIGVLRYYKGLHVLLRAAAQTSARIVIAGSGPEGDVLQKMAKDLGLANVVFAGQVSDAEKTALLKQCRALVLPSHVRSEAFGMVLIEASMFGKPMITCEIGTGTTFVNQHGLTGLVVPPDNPGELAQAIKSLMEDEVLASRFGRAARERYEAMFSADALGKAYCALYRKVLDAR